MSNHPRVQALFIELLELTGEDKVMPLSVLVNLHRRQLRAPLEMVSLLINDPQASPLGVIDQLYPAVDSELFNRSSELAHAEKIGGRFDTAFNNATGAMERFLLQDPDLAAVVDVARDNWVPYEPALVLYELSVTSNPVELLAGVLEVELELSPAAHDMLVDLGRRHATHLDEAGSHARLEA